MRRSKNWVVAKLRWISVLGLVFVFLSGSARGYALSGQSSDAADRAKIAPEVRQALETSAGGEMIPVIVTLKEQADLRNIGGLDRGARLNGVIRALQTVADASQRDLKALIEARRSQGLVSRATYFWVFDGVSLTAAPEVIDELAARPDVLKITSDDVDLDLESRPAVYLTEANLSVVNTTALWELGFFGQGVVVASMDTGVDLSHPELNPRWRGGGNSWFDPYGEHPDTPMDLSGHGTWTMGVMVGGDASGTSIGVAPQARWIAVKIFNDGGSATATAIHQGFQWLLDPDGDANTPDAPHVVNNSWTFARQGCDLEFEMDLQALTAAGIVPVFAAGNGGPNPGTSYSPANNPSAFAVGGTDNDDSIYLYSSQGPSSCAGGESVFPALVAPGVGIYTTDRFGLYTTSTGTSLSAPHVAGGLAVLLSSYPNLTAEEQHTALLNSAVDLGPGGADNTFGYGRLDLLAAHQWLQSGLSPTLTPTPTPSAGTNLALDQPVEVSSYQDSSHTGSHAVDGDLSTYWQSKVAGRNAPSSEWIQVDLGSQAVLTNVVLEWDAYFATSYTLQVSADGQSWNTVFSTTTGDGGSDTINLPTVSARYVMVDSIAWSNGGLRAWLKEFQVYGSPGAPPPTATPTAGPTDPPAPTATPTAGPTDPPAPTATPTDGGPGADILLSVSAYRAGGSKYADLSWSGSMAADVDVYRDGTLIATTGNDGEYTDGPLSRSTLFASYQVCEAGTTVCSTIVDVTW